MDLSNMARGLMSADSTGKWRTCLPGDRLYNTADGYRSGFGTYEERGFIVSSLCGYVCVVDAKGNSGNNKGNEKTVEIQQTEEGKKYISPVVGTIATARVVSISTKQATCKIFCVEDSILPVEFTATLRKEDMRERDIGKVVIWEFVKPGDIILARILGMGDAQTSFLLSIAENELGVISGVGDTGERLAPRDLQWMKSVKSDYKEKRKVAQVPHLNKELLG